MRKPKEHNEINTVIFIRCYQCSWFLQNAFILRFLISWFQTVQATVNKKIVFRWILMFVVKVNHEI